MIPEREREALMRLTMCARIECDICKYKDSSIDECDERITENMNILADALRADRKTENSSENPNNCEDEPQTSGVVWTEDAIKNEPKSYTTWASTDEPQTERSESTDCAWK